jgi:hypothetical protein
MNDVRIILSGLWVALTLTYLLGDLLRIFAGEIFGRLTWVLLAALFRGAAAEVRGTPATEAR